LFWNCCHRLGFLYFAIRCGNNGKPGAEKDGSGLFWGKGESSVMVLFVWKVTVILRLSMGTNISGVERRYADMTHSSNFALLCVQMGVRIEYWTCSSCKHNNWKVNSWNIAVHVLETLSILGHAGKVLKPVLWQSSPGWLKDKYHCPWC